MTNFTISTPKCPHCGGPMKASDSPDPMCVNIACEACGVYGHVTLFGYSGSGGLRCGQGK